MGGASSESQFGSLRVAWLQAFVLTVDNDKRTVAAIELKIGQGTITKHINRLESWYGGGPRRLLVLPGVWPPRLTEDGEAFLPVAREVLSLLQTARPPVSIEAEAGAEAEEKPAEVNASATARSPEGPKLILPTHLQPPNGDGDLGDASAGARAAEE